MKNVNLEINRGDVIGIVGETGSGKSTLGRIALRLIEPSSGSVMFEGQDITHLSPRLLREKRQRMQMVFQDPYSSLNSRHSVGDILTEPLWFYGFIKNPVERKNMAASMLSLVGMPPDAINKYPHQFSGGQRQRIAVARALLARPRFLICDEPTSALDVSIQAEILNLLKELQPTFGLTILFISHNLAVVRQMADDTAVLRNGGVEQVNTTDAVYEAPQAEYTKSLLAQTPVMPPSWGT